MSRPQALNLQHRLEEVLEPFEQELARFEAAQTPEEVQKLLQVSQQLLTLLSEVKNYFVDVRSRVSHLPGITPEKELAQLVIGAATEGLSALREMNRHLEEYKEHLRRKRRAKTLDELHYADFSAKEAIRRTRYIIRKIAAHADQLPSS